MTIKINDSISLEQIEDKHAAGIFEVVKNNKSHLSPWLHWVQHMHSLQHFKDFVTVSKKRFYNKLEVSFVIIYNEIVVGRIGLYNLDHDNKIASIGYWLSQHLEGKGIVTTACKAIIDYGFNALNLNRIEIKCGTENYRSKAIPERLNFINEGIIMQGEFVNNRFIDLESYSLLKEDWNNFND